MIGEGYNGPGLPHAGGPGPFFTARPTGQRDRAVAVRAGGRPERERNGDRMYVDRVTHNGGEAHIVSLQHGDTIRAEFVGYVRIGYVPFTGPNPDGAYAARFRLLEPYGGLPEGAVLSVSETPFHGARLAGRGVIEVEAKRGRGVGLYATMLPDRPPTRVITPSYRQQQPTGHDGPER